MPRKKQQPQEGKAPKMRGYIAGAGEIVQQDISDTLRQNFMPYAMSVIMSRAIPEIDGFKPSHRKLLYTMYQMHLLGGARTKSANVVGQTMKLNPHGDAAIYDTMVRLSRGYGALLTPFVDSKGNFGKVYSRDMAWAAPRYTEAKLTPICAELFRDIDSDTVDFVDNYDNTMKEPALLPTTFPNILVSANSGIAVGMASQFCGFNLKEVCDTTIAYLKNPDCDLMETLLAPDFPTGGELIFDRNTIREIYETGRGSVRVRAKYRYVKEENLIEIYEIPYSTTVEAILDKVAELIKAGRAKEIADMRDETDLSGLKLAIDLKRGVDPDKLMTKLYKLTPLEDAFACNFNVLIAGTPKVLGVRQILEEWTAWRTGSVRRRVYFVMKKKQDKLHLLRGLKKILLDIDRAIKIIRETEEDDQVVPNLMIGFGIDDVQAEYVADIKLRNINKEYILKRIEEVAGLEEEIADLQDIVNNPGRIKKLIVAELQAVQKKYAVPRRTEIVYEYQTAAAEDAEDETPDYPVHVFCSREGYFKKITPQSLRMSGEQKLKDGDEVAFTCESTNSAELLFFTNHAQVYKTRAADFSDSKASVLGDYVASTLGMDDGEVPIFMTVTTDYSGHMFFFFQNGKCAKVPLTSYQTKQNRRKLLKAYSDKAELAAILHLTEEQELAIFVNAGPATTRLLLAGSALIPEKTPRDTAGVNVVNLKKNARIQRVRPAAGLELNDPHRYRVRTLPAAGALLKETDSVEQMTL